jgi:hypothetical protein
MHGEDRRARREAIVREHLASENRAYFDETRTAFPDQRNELVALHHPTTP